MYPHITEDIVFFLYQYQLFLIAGIVIAVILAKYKLCWLAYLAGIVAQVIPMWEDYQYLAFNRYTHAMGGVIVASVIVAIAGIIIVKIRRKKVNTPAGVVFFCPVCAGTCEGTPGEKQGCPVCHKPTVETNVLYKDWTQKSDAEKAELKSS